MASALGRVGGGAAVVGPVKSRGAKHRPRELGRREFRFGSSIVSHIDGVWAAYSYDNVHVHVCNVLFFVS